jgi:hypothetical protein
MNGDAGLSLNRDSLIDTSQQRYASQFLIQTHTIFQGHASIGFTLLPRLSILEALYAFGQKGTRHLSSCFR